MVFIFILFIICLIDLFKRGYGFNINIIEFYIVIIYYYNKI